MIYFNREQISDNCIIFKAEDDGNILGSCKLILNASYAEINSVILTEASYPVFEGLLKAASFYAANRNYYMCRCSDENNVTFLEKMNFFKKESYYESDIPSILMGSCGNCNK